MAQASQSHSPIATGVAAMSMTWCTITACTAAGYRAATAVRTVVAVTATVSMAASSAAAPASISLTAARTVRGRGVAGHSRIRSAPQIRSHASARPTRVWPSAAVASSTARISSSLSARNDRG